MIFTNFQTEKGIVICYQGKEIALLKSCDNCTDFLEEIEPGAWRWVRKSDKPVNDMTMSLVRTDKTSHVRRNTCCKRKGTTCRKSGRISTNNTLGQIG